MFEIVKAGGWLMLPILACSLIAMTIVIERFWSLRPRRIVPKHLLRQIWQWEQQGLLDADRVRTLQRGSLLGRVLAAGLINRYASRQVMKEAIEETGRHVALELERFLNTLGTIASISPLLGLLGTVLGMIEVFNVITTEGVGDATQLAGGISQALITTAAGITVAMVALPLVSMLAAAEVTNSTEVPISPAPTG